MQDQTSETGPSYPFISAYCLDRRDRGINFAQNPRSEKFGIYIIRGAIARIVYAAGGRKVHAIISELQLIRGRSLWVHSRYVRVPRLLGFRAS